MLDSTRVFIFYRVGAGFYSGEAAVGLDVGDDGPGLRVGELTRDLRLEIGGALS